jgi:predicted amidohydrolase
VRAAAVSWAVREISDEQQFFDHLKDLVHRSADQGATLIVLPELAILELIGLFPGAAGRDIPLKLEPYATRYEIALRDLERETGALIVGGSHIRDNWNVCFAGGDHVGKRVLTQWEKVEWGLEPAPGSRTPMITDRIGVTICYDCEFPESGRAIAEAGALVQCIPAYTETRRGFQRVRWCALARATENQLFVIHASLVGSLGREPVPMTYGSSAILTPSIEPFPESAILAETALGEEGIAVADLDFDLLLKAREQGDVRNWNDRHAAEWR